MNSSYWNEQLVMAYLQQTAGIQRRMPAVNVPGYRSLWPEPLRDDWHRLYDIVNGRARLGAPMPPEVTFHDAVIEWLPMLERRQQQILWARANRMPWKIMVDEFGRSKPTLWRELRRALAQLASHLNASDPTGEKHDQLRRRAQSL